MRELVRHLGIDWKLLLAQAVNFFVLLYVLKHFAYGPIIKMLHERRERIAEGERFRLKAEVALKESETEKEKILAGANAEALHTINKAQKQAQAVGSAMLKESSKKGETIILEAQKRTEEERIKMTERVLDDAGDLIKAGIAKVLGKMPAEEKNSGLVREALNELKANIKNI